MKVSGFTFIRNAILYDYPIVESIKSILPLCDEVVIAVGKSDDKTHELILSIDSPKIKIIETEWDLSLREGGQVLAIETNKALASVSKDSDWCFYIQGDEVIHEKYHENIKKSMTEYLNHKQVEGLLFKYKHFYGSYDFIGDSRKWYRNEIRIIRNKIGAESYKDAQGFRINNRKLRVKEIDAFVYHYGWVKPPDKQSEKIKNFLFHWHSDDYIKNHKPEREFDYSQIDSLERFTGTHPYVMQHRIKQKNWSFDFDPTQKKLSPVNWILYIIEKYLGIRIGEYKNYKKI